MTLKKQWVHNSFLLPFFVASCEKNIQPQISQMAQIVLKDMTHSCFEKFLLFSFLLVLIC
jgi:hypothetical protein